MPKKMTIVEKWKEHRKKLSGAELPYLPYLAEEFCIHDEITEEIHKNTEEGKLLRWYTIRIHEGLDK